MTEVDLYLASRKKHISPNYLRDTATVLRAWQRSNPGPISTQSIQAWLDSLDVKPATIAAYAFTLRQFFDWCIKCKLVDVPANPVLAIDLPRIRRPFRKVFIKAPQVAMLINGCADPELRYCLYCGFHAGLRFSEVVASQPAWFDLENKMVRILRSETFDTKDHTDRDIPLTDDFLAFLQTYGMRAPYMVAPHKLAPGKHRYRFDFSNRFQNYVRAKNVNITFHDLRRTFCSLHVSAGTSVYKVAKWIGDDVEVVQRHYGHLSESDPEINRAFISS